MASIQERYDATADRYRRWWGPILASTGLSMLDAAEAALAGDEPVRRILDLGTGTGLLAIDSVRRWPDARVTGLDVSTGMLSVAADEARRKLDDEQRGRLRFVAADAERLPFADVGFDLVVSSFVLQLVRRRAPVFREVHRVLRPGGRLVFVTWLVGRDDERFEPDAAFEDVLDELEIDEPDADETEARSGDVASPDAAAVQLRRAGFRAVHTTVATLEHQFDPARYIDFLAEYGERDVFDWVDPATRRRLFDRTAERLARLPTSAFSWLAPVVIASGERPLSSARPRDGERPLDGERPPSGEPRDGERPPRGERPPG